MTEVPVKIIKKNGKVVEPDDWMDDPIKADKWQNLYFSKSGSTYKPKRTHETEEAAKARATKWENIIAKDDGSGWIAEWGISALEYSHCIQLPVKS